MHGDERGTSPELIPPRASKLIESEDVLISPMVQLEIQYLYAIGKITVPAPEIIEELSSSIFLKICDLPFQRIAAAAMKESWTRDPFDRIIASQAKVAAARTPKRFGREVSMKLVLSTVAEIPTLARVTS